MEYYREYHPEGPLHPVAGQQGPQAAQTLTDPKATATTKTKRDVLMVSTGAAGFLTFLRDLAGVISPIVGNPP